MLLAPQLAKSAEVTSLSAFITDDSWVMEQKLDGHRVLLVAPELDMPPTALTRNGNLYSRKLPQAIRDFRFPPGKWVLDGELVDGTYYVFDLPVSPIFERSNPAMATLSVRRQALEALLDNIGHPFKLVPQARNRAEKITLADTALRNNFEGLLLKKRDSLYIPAGRTTDWLKLKFVVTADVVVLDVRDDGKDSVRLGLYTADGLLQDVGRASLIGKEKRCPINQGDVVEVRYLYVGAGGRLYQPTLLKKRDDKRPDECTDDQLKHVNKSVLEAL